VLGEQRLDPGRRVGVRHVCLLPGRADTAGRYTRSGARPGTNATDRAPFEQLLAGVSLLTSLLAGIALAVALLEARHPATAVEDLLLAGVEGMALRAHLDHDVAVLLGAAGL